MNLLLPHIVLSHIPSIAGGIVVGGIVIASGGSWFQSGVAAIATGGSGYATSALLIQTQIIKQKSIERECDQLKRDVERQKRALPFGAELEDLQRRRELLQQNVKELKQQEEDLRERVRLVQQNPPNLEELERCQQKIGELKTQIHEHTGRFKAVIDQIAEREKQRDDLQDVTLRFLQKQEEVRGLTERLREINQQVAELEIFRSTYDALRADAQSLETKKQSLQAEILRLEQECDRILAKIGTMEEKTQQVDGLRVQIEELEEELRGKYADLNSSKREIARLNSEKDLLDAEISRKSEKLGILQKQEEAVALNERLRELNQQVAELEIFRSTYDALRADAQNLETKKQSLQAEIPRLEQERDRIFTEIGTKEEKVQEVNGLGEQIKDLETELRGQRSDLNSLKREMAQLNSEKDLLYAEISDKSQELKKIQEEIRKAKGELQGIGDADKLAFQALEIPIKLEANQTRIFASEKEFLANFRKYLNNKGLIFPERIVNAFHTSLKVQDISALVILAGISGTGKSELPQAYAEFVGAPLVMLPVQPRWDSPQDLQGFYNYIEKKYKPTDLMRYLYQHERNPELKGRIVMVLLDEMNLARVEYYFSDFLSKLETRRNKKTYLELEAGSLKLKDHQKQVLIPEEFLFIGTMNEDETTQSLSDKVLDRANVLTFGRPPELKLRGSRQNKPTIANEYLPWEVFQGWTKEPSPDLVEKVKHYVDQANDIMESLGRPFAHRVFQAFTKYVCNYPNADRDEAIRNQAIADQFGQKLLPKLRGVMVEEKTVKEALDKMESLLSQLNDEPLNQAFRRAREGQYGQFQWKGMIYPQD